MNFPMATAALLPISMHDSTISIVSSVVQFFALAFLALQREQKLYKILG